MCGVVADRQHWRGGYGSAPSSLSESARAFLSYLKIYRACPAGTVEAYACDLRGLLRFLETEHPHLRAPAELSREVLMEWALTLGELAPRTIRRKVACVSSLFAFLQDFGQVEANPARRLPLPTVPRTLPRILSQQEARRLVKAARSPCGRSLLVVMLTTGIRRGEASQARLADLDLRHRQLLVRGKGAKERAVPLCRQAVEALRQYLPWRRENGVAQLWLNDRGHPLTVKAINLLVRRIAREAGLQGVTPHKLRHTFATELIRRGTDIRTAQELLGHSDIQSTATYLHSDTRLKARAVGKLPKFLP